MKNKFFSLLLLCFVLFAGQVQAQIPPVPNPPRLVNDFANILSPNEISALEHQLVSFNDSTSNVICIVTVNDLGNYSAAQFAYEIGEEWGVRSKDYKNGIIILIKPRTNTAGEVYIAVGYDLEGVLPDATAKKIVEYEMIPQLKEGRYYSAIDNALKIILPIVAGEISHDRYTGDSLVAFIVVFAIFLIFVIVLIVVFRKKGGGNSGNSGDGSFWKALWLASMASGGRGSGSSRGGGFSGGGFGGFGGRGGFGGGGAGGRF